uniref:Uncharacterized protein n=1 Tax=Utricularia reniformis TaxID=192314 RepID=A0A1Y0B031_9LAMI|nr:hypothetical protein AEK19_MT0504 [Utricularia reniformis]ART30760.1 hypothetical protein AEK19_MT0504 [Utricularia reniformis]
MKGKGISSSTTKTSCKLETSLGSGYVVNSLVSNQFFDRKKKLSM